MFKSPATVYFLTVPHVLIISQHISRHLPVVWKSLGYMQVHRMVVMVRGHLPGMVVVVVAPKASMFCSCC